MKRQTRFCRLFTACLFAASANVITNRKLTSYDVFLHRKVNQHNIQVNFQSYKFSTVEGSYTQLIPATIPTTIS